MTRLILNRLFNNSNPRQEMLIDRVVRELMIWQDQLELACENNHNQIVVEMFAQALTDQDKKHIVHKVLEFYPDYQNLWNKLSVVS